MGDTQKTETQAAELQNTEKKKKATWRKVLKIVIITLCSLVFIVLLAVGIALYIVFTSEKVTNVVNKYADNFLNANVQFEEVEITFLSTFPKFYLTINDGVIVSKALSQDAPKYNQTRDTLLRFSGCNIELDPVKYLKTKDLDIKEISFDGVSANAYVDELGHANWDIFLPSETPADTTPFIIDDYIHSIDVKKIAFHTNTVNYDDLQSNMKATFSKLNLDLSGDFYEQQSNINLGLSLEGIYFQKDTVQVANNLSFSINTKLKANLKKNRYDLDSALLYINQNKFCVDGYVSLPDTDLIAMDLQLTSLIPALSLAKQLIPEAYLPILKQVKAEGCLVVNAYVKGVYGRNKMPKIKADFNLSNASFKYSELSFAIKDLNILGNATVYLDNSQVSNAEIQNFTAKSDFVNLKLSATAKNILNDPQIEGLLNGSVNIEKALRHFPVLPKGMTLSGKGDINLKINTLLSSITNSKWERVKANAQLKLKNIKLQSPKDTMFIDFKTADINLQTNIDTKQLYTPKALAFADAKIEGLSLTYTDLAQGDISNVEIKAQLSPEVKDIVTSLLAKINLNSVKMNVMSEIDFLSENTSLNLSLQPSKKQLGSPVIDCKLGTSGTMVALESIMAKIGDAKWNITLRPLLERRNINDTTKSSSRHRYRDLATAQALDYLLKSIETPSNNTDTTDIIQQLLSYWDISTNMNLNTITARLDMLNYPVNIPSANVEFLGRDLKLKDTKLKVAHSDLQIDGVLKNVRRAIMKKDKYVANLKISSNSLYVGELMNILASDDDIEYGADVESLDSVPMEVIVVPKDLDITMQTDLKSVHYSNAEFKNVNGEVILRNQYIILNDLNFKSTLCDVNTTLFYKASDKSGADVSAELNLKKLNITKLTTQLPIVDSMLPMLHSFEGLISTDIVVLGKLDSNMNIDMPSMLASCYIRGDSLVLLDNETFRKLSKILLFKNKDKNLIDSLSLEFIMKNEAITFFPFILQMDRYKVGILGLQNVDMTFNYEFHVLKWPLLLKMLIKYDGDINNLDDAKLRIRYDKNSDYFNKTQNSSIIRQQVQGILRKGRKQLMGQ